jgi:hypothetical protein
MAVFAFILAMAAALAVRIVLGANVAGYQVDMNCFAAWSLRMAGSGPVGFYAADYFCDYPPGYMLLLWPVGLLIRAVGYADSPGVRLLIKAMPILFDMITATALFAYAKKRIPVKAAVFVALLFALNPAVLINGAAWGQADTVLSLLLFFTAVTAMERNWRAALPLYVVAVLVKPQALLFAPVGGVWLIVSLVTAGRKGRKPQWKGLWQGLAIALGCAAAIVVPFSIGQDNPLWLFDRYRDTLSSYNYASLNTANLMYLLGGNWSRLSTGDGESIATLSGAIQALKDLLSGNWVQRGSTGVTTLSAWIPVVTACFCWRRGYGRGGCTPACAPTLARSRRCLAACAKSRASVRTPAGSSCRRCACCSASLFVLSAFLRAPICATARPDGVHVPLRPAFADR